MSKRLSPKISVIVPAFNEEQSIGLVLKELVSLNFVKQVVVVDDASTDRTSIEIAKCKSPKIQCVQHLKNRGKTQAIATGLKLVKEDITIIQDADREYRPKDIAGVIQPILAGHAHVSYGSRFLVKETMRVLYFYHYLANKFLTFLSNLFTNLNFSDMETGYKAFLTPIIQELPFTSRGFGMEVEITALISKLPLRIYEVPISYYGHTYQEGKKIGWKDGLLALFYIFYFNLIAPYTKKRRLYFSRVRKKLSL